MLKMNRRRINRKGTRDNSLEKANASSRLLFKLLLFGAFWIFFIQHSSGQTVGAEGFVLDDATGEGLPYTNVYFLRSTIGTTTDSTGRFKLITSHQEDTLVFSQVGYQTVKLGMKKRVVFHVVIRMKEDHLTLGEVVIKPGENPAFPIIRQIIRHRKKNDPSRLNRFSTKTYTNVAARFTNINLSDIKSDLLKQLQKYMPHQKNKANMGFIPLFYSEKIAKTFRDHKKGISQNQVIAFKENGLGLLKDLKIARYSNSLSTTMDFYDNYIDLYGHNFVSPIGGLGRQFYKYYLSDSIMQKGRMLYTIKYVPKNDKDLAFTGKFTVIKDLWAVVDIEASLPRIANVNFLNRFDVSYIYQILNDTISFFKSNTIIATFNYNKLPNNGRSMLEINMFTSYKDIKTGLTAHQLKPVVSKNPALSKTEPTPADTLFLQYRKANHNISATQTMQSIDSINNIGWVRFMNKTTDMFVTEYYNFGKYDVGPFLNLLQYNKVEGMRLSFGGRTGALFNPYYSAAAMVGYGLKDKQWKYNTNFTWKFNSKKRTILSLHLSKNLQLFGVYGHIHLIKENLRTVGEDSFISAIFKRTQNERRALFYKTSLYFEHQWKKGFSSAIILENNKIQDNTYVPFVQNGLDIKQIRFQQATLKVRLSWHETILDRFLRRYYLGTHYPIINLLGTIGQYEAGSQTGNYYKIHMTLKHRFLLGIPMIRYIVETGAVFGKVPFPLLEIHRGNESYGLSRFRFNLLNNASVASDRYFSFMGEIFLNGIVMNRIPLLRQLNIRSVLSTKYLYSQLSNKHVQVVSLPWNMSLPGHQYLEFGVGITNIFKFLRVDYVWRVLPKTFPTMPNQGVRIKIEIDL